MFSPEGVLEYKELTMSDWGGRGSVYQHLPCRRFEVCGNGVKVHGLTCDIGSAAQSPTDVNLSLIHI